MNKEFVQFKTIDGTQVFINRFKISALFGSNTSCQILLDNQNVYTVTCTANEVLEKLINS